MGINTEQVNPNDVFVRACKIVGDYAPVERAWAGREVPDSAVVYWKDGVVAITRSEEHPGAYTFGVYDADDWFDGTEPLCDYVNVVGVDAAMALLDDLTALQPEGTDWSAWASVWMPDAVCDGRVEGVVGV